MPPYLHDLYTNETKTGERTTGNIFEFHNFNTLHYHINPLITIIALRDQCTIFLNQYSVPLNIDLKLDMSTL